MTTDSQTMESASFDSLAESVESVRAAAPTAPTKAPARKLSRRTLVVVALAALAVGGGGAAYASTLGYESTDDAQVDAEVVAVPARLAGTVKKLDFVENQQVKAGELLAELDDDQARARLAQAEAALESAQAAALAADADARVASENAVGNKAASQASLATATLGANAAGDQIREAQASLAAAEATRDQARIDRDRAVRLAADGAVAQASLDQAETSFSLAASNAEAARARLAGLTSGLQQATSRIAEARARAQQSADVGSLVAQAEARASQAHAQVDTARAARDLAALDLSYTKIYAPHDGVVSKKAIAEGQEVAAGQSVVQLVTPGVWVTANFKETQLENMRVGQPVTLRIDAFPSAPIRGEVESFSGGTGAKFALLPPDNASGNFTKIVQRVPVRIRVTDAPVAVPLRPGLSADVRVTTRG